VGGDAGGQRWGRAESHKGRGGSRSRDDGGLIQWTSPHTRTHNTYKPIHPPTHERTCVRIGYRCGGDVPVEEELERGLNGHARVDGHNLLRAWAGNIPAGGGQLGLALIYM
jgi:hypothetical protein